jgi:hypothetical protein
MKYSIASAVAALIVGCAAPPTTDSTRTAELASCGLQNDPSITPDCNVGACSSTDTGKTTICHFPPGDHANAHTLCVGDSSVQAHIREHGDTLGQCSHESSCGSDDVDAGAGSAGSGSDGSGHDGSGSGSGGGGGGKGSNCSGHGGGGGGGSGSGSGSNSGSGSGSGDPLE